MKKKSLKGLRLSKKTIANINKDVAKGGIPNNNTFNDACVTQMITMCFGAPQCKLFATVEVECRGF